MSVELEEKTTDAREYVQQAELLIGQQMYQEALEYLEKAKHADQMYFQIYIDEGITYANLEDYDQAKKSIEKAKLLDKDNPLVYYHLGNIAFINADHVEGVTNYNKAIALGYDDSSLYYNLALVYEQRGEADLAIRNYSKAIYRDPLEPAYRIRKASLYLQDGDYEEAAQASQELMQNCPDQFEGYHIGAGAYTLLNQYDKAEAVLAKAEALFPEDTDIMLDRLRLLVVQQKLEEAISYIKRLEEASDSEIDKRTLIIEEAKLYMQQEKLEEAAELLEGIKQNAVDEPVNTESHYYLLNIYLILEKYDQLLKHAELLAAIEPADNFSLAGHYYKALALNKLGRDCKNEYKEAISYYRKRTFEDSTSLDAYLFRCMCLKDIGEYDKALELVDYVMLLYKDSADLHIIKGNILREQGETAKAEAEMASAKRINPNIYIPE